MAKKEKVKLRSIQIVDMTSSKKTKVKRSDAQREAARKNAQKARAAKASYADLRKRGFSRETIYTTTETIQEELTKNYMSSETNPAVSQLLTEIGGRFREPEELKNMSQAEYFKYATSIRQFLGSPLTAKDAADYLKDRFSNDLFSQSLLIRDKEDFSAYKDRRARFIKATEDTISKQAFKIYRKLMETNAGQIIKARVSPTAYGSDNLIVDLFDFVNSGHWYDSDIDMAVGYWNKIIEDQVQANTERMQDFQKAAQAQEAHEIPKFNWRGAELYAFYANSKR